MTLEELNDLVAKESTKLTKDNWLTGILQVIENILRDHNMIPDDMTLRWARRSIPWDRDSVMLYVPETKDAFTLFSVPTYKLPPDAHFKPEYIVHLHFALLDTYIENQSLQAAIDKAVIALYIDKTDRETSEYELKKGN